MDKAQVERRKSELEMFVSESFSVNTDFAARLGLANPHAILMDFDALRNFIFQTVHDFIKTQAVD